ncbi:MAG: TIGR03790 family protein [Acidobacteria bacterium]|nr:TIGR03790 family protein [Acidobacteriota bacterium]
MRRLAAAAGAALMAATFARGQGPNAVLVVINDASALSRSIGEYYARKRGVPLRNVCHIDAPTAEAVDRRDYNQRVALPIARCLADRKLREAIRYIVTTAGAPLIINGEQSPSGDIAAVDSELTLLYGDMARPRRDFRGTAPNPMFGRLEDPFDHKRFPIYMVTRLAGYDFADVRGMIDRATLARNRGRFVIDLRDYGEDPGEDWLRAAARRLPRDRVTLDETSTVLYGQKDVIGYASWGSNDKRRQRRLTGNQWLPGALATEFVSTNARTFQRPPDTWTLGVWSDPRTWYAGAPQSLIGDYIHEGATGVTGHVAEPYLAACPRPDLLFSAYIRGRNLAESFYLSIPFLSWQNIVAGDPLCALRP